MSPPAPTGGGRKGFTLLEMAIALAVSVILLAMALPSLGERMARERLSSVAHELSADLMLARHEAAQRRRPVHLVFRGGADWCWALSLADAGDCHATAAGDAQTIKAVQGKDHPGIQLLDAMPFLLDPRDTQPRPPNADTAGRADFGDRYREQLRVQLTPMGRPGVCVVSGRLPGLPHCAPAGGS